MAVMGKASIRTLYSGVSERRHHSCGTTDTILQRRDVSSSAALMIVFRLRQTAPTENSSSSDSIGSALMVPTLRSLQRLGGTRAAVFPPPPSTTCLVDVLPLFEFLDGPFD